MPRLVPSHEASHEHSPWRPQHEQTVQEQDLVAVRQRLDASTDPNPNPNPNTDPTFKVCILNNSSKSSWRCVRWPLARPSLAFGAMNESSRIPVPGEAEMSLVRVQGRTFRVV